MAEVIKEVVGYNGKISFDSSKPDGSPKKLIDVKRLERMGWTYSTKLADGLKKLYSWYLNEE